LILLRPVVDGAGEQKAEEDLEDRYHALVVLRVNEMSLNEF